MPPNWDVLVLRATLFTADLIASDAVETWWNRVVSADAEEIQRKPSLGTYTLIGPSPVGEGATITLVVLPGRMDWLVQLKPEDVLQSRTLGKLEVGERFVEFLTPLLQQPSVNIARVAFGAVLKLPAENRIDGYKVLAKLLPRVTIDPEKSRDLLYQINRPRESKALPGMSVNRISKWATVVMQVSTSTGTGPTNTSPAAYHIQLELDISTDQASKRDLSKDGALLMVFKEMFTLGAEIAEKGDIE